MAGSPDKSSGAKKSLRIGPTDWRIQEAAAKAAGLDWGAIAKETLARHFADVARDMSAGGELEGERARAVRRGGDSPRVRITRLAAQHWGCSEDEARRRIADGEVLLNGAVIERSTIFEYEVEELEWR